MSTNGYVPWNKGLTMQVDKRIVASRPRLLLTKDQQNIVKIKYLNGDSIINISKETGITIRPIRYFLDTNKLRRNCSEARKLSASKNKKSISSFNYKGHSLRVINGQLNKFFNLPFTNSLVECECDMCKDYFTDNFQGVKRRYIQGNNNVYCKKCSGLYARTKFNKYSINFSSQQLAIQEMLGGELNYRIGHIFVDVALIEDKIIVEYDGYYWHKNLLVAERKRDEFLKSQGWKILRIRSRRLIPNKELLLSTINILKNSNQYFKQIYMKDWGEQK